MSCSRCISQTLDPTPVLYSNFELRQINRWLTSMQLQYPWYFRQSLNLYPRVMIIVLLLQVLVAPVTEKGALQRDIYLPESDFQWQDTNNAQVFDGGTFLESYPVGLGDVPVFIRWRSWASSTTIIVPLFVLFSNCTFHKDHYLCLEVSWDLVENNFTFAL